MERQNSGKDLEGLLVVTVEQAVAAPYTVSYTHLTLPTSNGV